MTQPTPPDLPPRSTPPVLSPTPGVAGQGPPQKKGMSGWAIGCIVAAVLGIPIFVIAVLASFALPAYNGIRERAQETSALNTGYQLKAAVVAYLTEYRRFPIVSAPQGDTDTTTEGELVRVLLGLSTESDGNMVFFSGRPAVSDGEGGWRNGVYEDAEQAGIYDPWGSPYFVRADTNFDNQVADPSGAGPVQESVIVWSAGPDGDADTWEDNPKTW